MLHLLDQVCTQPCFVISGTRVHTFGLSSSLNTVRTQSNTIPTCTSNMWAELKQTNHIEIGLVLGSDITFNQEATTIIHNCEQNVVIPIKKCNLGPRCVPILGCSL